MEKDTDIMNEEEITTSELREIIVNLLEADRTMTIFRIKQMAGLEN